LIVFARYVLAKNVNLANLNQPIEPGSATDRLSFHKLVAIGKLRRDLIGQSAVASAYRLRSRRKTGPTRPIRRELVRVRLDG
jgi:hypothetical protein